MAKNFIIIIFGVAALLCIVLKADINTKQQDLTSDCSTDEYSLDSSDDEDEVDRFCVGEDRITDEEQASFSARLIDGPLSRLQTLKVAQRMVELLQRPRISHPGCRISATLNLAAQRLIKFATQEDYSFLSDDDMPPEPKRMKTINDDYCDLLSIDSPRRRVSMNTMRIILDMVARNTSVKTIQAKYTWYRPNYVPNFRRCVASDRMVDNLAKVNDYVLEKFRDARNRFLPVHSYLLIDWGHEKAQQLNITEKFRGSKTWVYNFKKRNGITSRSITEFSSRAEQEREEEIEESKRLFKDEFTHQEFMYPRRMIWNMDQTGFNYEILNKRTLSWRGERDTVINVDQANRATHSYTSQPMISRDGRVVGKLLLCMQEPSGSFGPQVQQRIRELERSLGNIKIYASKSGKMSKQLMLSWVDDVLKPAIEDHLGPDDSRTEIYDYTRNEIGNLALEDQSFNNIAKENALLLIDSWSGQTNDDVLGAITTEKIAVQVYPARTTADLQPLDVTFNRQYKKFVKRVLERAAYENLTANITSREGAIRLHSLVWTEFSAIDYQDMLRYAWRKTDQNFVDEELNKGPPPPMVHDIQFNFDRSQECSCNCTRKAFLKCAHTGRVVCLRHFMSGKCRPNVSESDPGFEFPHADHE